MPYLIKNKTGLVLINATKRNGLFLKYFSTLHSSRNNILYNSSTEEYAVNMDNNNNIHIALKDKNNHIIHLYQQGNRMLQNTLLEDENNSYKISNLKLINSNNKTYLFYTALNPNENTTDIIHHIIDNEDKIPPQSVIPIINLNTSYSCYTHNDNLYLLSISNDNNKYNLELSNYNKNNEWVYINNLVNSSFPITYCNMCIDANGIFHIVYAQNQFGKYIVNYIQINKSNQQTKQIHSCAISVEPITFMYNNTLWINWKESDKLLMSVSTDNGKTFSIPQYCSIEGNNISLVTYIYNKKEFGNLFGNTFYCKFERIPELVILNQIDMDNINLYSKTNNELKTYITSLKNTYSTKYKKEYEKLLQENQHLKDIQKNITSQYENLTQLTKTVQKEGKKWRNKFYESQQKAKDYQAKLEDIEKSP